MTVGGRRMTFIVLGEPMGKGRPKFTHIGGFARAYTPEKTANYETLVRLTYQQEIGTLYEGPVKMEINAFYGIPKAANKKLKAQMRAGEVYPLKKPDADNVAKIICDALNGIAYHDDTQVVKLTINKFYGEIPQTNINIQNV